ncbi:hypothetical protein ABTE28_20665 [Acinetobacter baumannii]
MLEVGTREHSKEMELPLEVCQSQASLSVPEPQVLVQTDQGGDVGTG